ncbi:TetR/AcrR family transcriptional regulator [Phytomonospora endophytica]|uniref:AcrR family transcriptional regulator n=1 Tax=Phytomonospora endophytica TaxID=714109 RepID=A0A841FVU6_9ACTN|nr:TetR family transcriptional regulator [Phytomonospora endophytica]MBB6037858.1 AcrR family transcriptional regulator [Phytomonospora endophytica]GIG68757.1 TetR family transcriptional regulator [Phytomonospora endophytica]
MPPKRRSADHRRADAVAAGMRIIAALGPSTAAVQQVADEIGVSQPYVFRLFGGKREFFLACLDELEARVRKVFAENAAIAPGDPFITMGEGFRETVGDGVAGGLLFQALAAARHDEVIAARCRALIAGVLAEVQDSSGATAEEVADFFASGTLVLVLQAVGADLTGGSREAVARLRATEESR